MAAREVHTIAAAAALLILSACSAGPEIEAGIFFPTWNAGGARPAGIVQGILVERNGCLLLTSSGEETFVVWEKGYGYVDGALLSPSGEPIVRVGEMLHGGGGYYDAKRVERLSGTSIPDRCAPDGPDSFAIIYGVEAGPFE